MCCGSVHGLSKKSPEPVHIGVNRPHSPFDYHATRRTEFRMRWAGHYVHLHDHGTKRFHHPVVGGLTLSFEELPLLPIPA